MASLPASLASPARLRTAPFAWSTLPSVSSFLLPVTCPATSLVLPATLSAAPFTYCSFMCHLYATEMLVDEQRARAVLCVDGLEVYDREKPAHYGLAFLGLNVPLGP